MQINTTNLDNILSNNATSQGYKHWVIFGTDAGAVLIAKNKILNHYRNIDSESISNDIEQYSYKEINEDLDKLYITLSTKSLFGNITHAVISDYPDSCTKEWEKILANTNFCGSLIILADELKKSGKMRKVCETMKHIAVINCYKIDVSEIASNITKEFLKMNIEFDHDIPNIIAERLPQDSLVIQKELEKIFLYMSEQGGKKKHLTSKEIIEIIANESTGVLEDLALAFVTKNKKLLINEFQKAIANNMNIIFILRALQNYLNRILDIKYVITQQNVPIYHALNNAKPPLFGKMKNDVQYILENISITKLRKLMFRIIKIELLFKSGKIYNEKDQILNHLMEE